MKIDIPTKLIYPSLFVGKDGSIVASEEQEYVETNSRVLRNGYFDNLSIFSSDMYIYRVSKLTIIPPDKFHKSVIECLTGNRLVLISVNRVSTFVLQDLKAVISEVVHDHVDFYSEAYDIEDLLYQVGSRTNFHDIFLIFK